jgi:uncharacterized protein YehS (DUF1456 family)
MDNNYIIKPVRYILKIRKNVSHRLIKHHALDTYDGIEI